MHTLVWLGGLVFVLVALMLTLTGLACPSPPDLTWIAGLYDDDDSDNVVDCITSTSHLVVVPVIADLRPLQPPIALQLQPADDIAAFVLLSAFGPRAPPTV